MSENVDNGMTAYVRYRSMMKPTKSFIDKVATLVEF